MKSLINSGILLILIVLFGKPVFSQVKYLHKYSKAEVLAKIYHNKDSIIQWTNNDISEWAPIDSSVLVLNNTELIVKENNPAFEICLLKEINGNLTLIAKGTIEDKPIQYNPADKINFYFGVTGVDLKLYKISKNEYAIGVTGTPSWVNNGRNYYNYGVDLILFRINETGIYPVLKLPLEYTHGDRHQSGNEIITDGEESDRSVIMMLKTGTNGFYDIVLKTKHRSFSNKNKVARVTMINTMYKWKNGRYVESK